MWKDRQMQSKELFTEADISRATTASNERNAN